MKQPQKRNQTSFAVAPGKEPKGRMMGFRPLVSLERQIDEAVAASGMSLADWLMEAAIAYLQKNPLELARGGELKQGQLMCAHGSTEDALTSEPTNAAGDREQSPTSGDATAGKDEARNTRTQRVGQAAPTAGTRARKAAGTRGGRKQTSGTSRAGE